MIDANDAIIITSEEAEILINVITGGNTSLTRDQYEELQKHGGLSVYRELVDFLRRKSDERSRGTDEHG